MNQTKKDQIFEQLKNTWANREEIRKQAVERLNSTKATVEMTAKVLLEQSKTNPLVHEYIVPIMENEKTEKALNKIHQTVGENKLLSGFEKFRKELIEAKVSQAKTVASQNKPEAQEATSAPKASQEEKVDLKVAPTETEAPSEPNA